MTKEKYNTKDIKHIDEKSQEYIAKGNRMTEVLNCDYFNRNRGFNCYKGYNCTDKECYDCYYRQLKRLEQENKELKDEFKPYKHPDVVTLLTNWRTGELDRIHNKIANERDTYRSALEEIRGLASPHCTQCSHIIKIVNEVLK